MMCYDTSLEDLKRKKKSKAHVKAMVILTEGNRAARKFEQAALHLNSEHDRGIVARAREDRGKSIIASLYSFTFHSYLQRALAPN